MNTGKGWPKLSGAVIFLIVFGMLGFGRTESLEHEKTRILPVEERENRPLDNSKILVELFLAKERKADLAKIKEKLGRASITRIRAQFFRLGTPPDNIAIGKDIPASVARLALQLAVDYNVGVNYLLPEFRFFPLHIAIGTSAFDEKSQIPITAEDLKKLRDPSLNTSQFHALYRSLTGEDKGQPPH